MRGGDLRWSTRREKEEEGDIRTSRRKRKGGGKSRWSRGREEARRMSNKKQLKETQN